MEDRIWAKDYNYTDEQGDKQAGDTGDGGMMGFMRYAKRYFSLYELEVEQVT